MLTEVKNNLKIMFLSIKYNIMRCMENNIAFTTSVISMIFNNATFIIQWITLFGIKETIGGYTFNNVMLFWALASGSAGLAHVLFNGVFSLPEYIEEGKLDSYLVMPKNVLCHVATSSTEPSAFGDLIYGYIALILFNFSIRNLLLFTILIIFGAIVYTSFCTIFYSINFYKYRFSLVTEALRDVMINGMLYPDVIFGKIAKLLFYTLIPAAFATWIPVHLIMSFNIMNFIILLIFTVSIVIFTFIFFNRALKNYSSSNLMGARS